MTYIYFVGWGVELFSLSHSQDMNLTNRPSDRAWKCSTWNCRAWNCRT